MAWPKATAGARWRIGVSQREVAAGNGREAHDALDASCVSWLMALLPEALVVPIPNFVQATAAVDFAHAVALNSLVLSGGGDIDGQQRRNAVERALLERARPARWPVVGICRGMQMLQTLHGGDLHLLPGHVGSTHPLDIDAKDSAFLVNSWHRYGIRDPATDWRVLARAADNSVEAFRHADLPWIGLMWHPERAEGGASICSPWLADIFSIPPDVKGN